MPSPIRDVGKPSRYTVRIQAPWPSIPGSEAIVPAVEFGLPRFGKANAKARIVGACVNGRCAKYDLTVGEKKGWTGLESSLRDRSEVGLLCWVRILVPDGVLEGQLDVTYEVSAQEKAEVSLPAFVVDVSKLDIVIRRPVGAYFFPGIFSHF
jgi:hypothetical protein